MTCFEGPEERNIVWPEGQIKMPSSRRTHFYYVPSDDAGTTDATLDCVFLCFFSFGLGENR